jgi:hypothetical protein
VTGGALTVSPVGLSRSTGCPASPALPGVPWAVVPHLPGYDAPLRLPCCPSRGPALVARAPIPCLLPSVRGVPKGLGIWSKPPDHARACGCPVPHSGNVTRTQRALPSPRAPPGHACPALRPRWGPAHAPCAHSGLLPAGQWTPSAFPSDNLERYPLVHDSTHVGAPSRGLPPRSLQLRTPIPGCARGVRSWPAGSALVRGDLHHRFSPPGEPQPIA